MKYVSTYLTLLLLLAVDYVQPDESTEATCLPEKITFTVIDLLDTYGNLRMSLDFSQNRLLAVSSNTTYVGDLNTNTVYETDHNGICRSYEGKGTLSWRQCFDPEAQVKIKHSFFGPSQEMKLIQYTITKEEPNNMAIFGLAYISPNGLIPIGGKDVINSDSWIFLFVDHSLEIPDSERFQLPSLC